MRSLYELVLKRLLREASSDPGSIDLGRVHRALRGWISGAVIDPDVAADVRLLMASPEHKRIFREPSAGSEVYRGMKVTREIISKWTGMPVESVADSDDADVDFVLGLKEPAGGLASWTYDMSVAEDFAHGSGKSTRRGDYGVVLVAQVENNPGKFLDLHAVATSLGGFQRSSASEQEVLAVGPVRVDQVAWTRLRG